MVKSDQWANTFKINFPRTPLASDLEQNKHIRNIYNLIKELLEPSTKKPKPIGFRIKSNKE